MYILEGFLTSICFKFGMRKKKSYKYRKALVVYFVGSDEKLLLKFKELTKLDDRIKKNNNIRDTNGRMMYVVRKLVALYNQQTLKYLQEKNKGGNDEANKAPNQEENISPNKEPDIAHVPQ